MAIDDNRSTLIGVLTPLALWGINRSNETSEIGLIMNVEVD